MNFVKLPVDGTTIFPIANSSVGGQLLTEYNQLSRETVANHSIIPYVCGPSYTHSLNDFKINTNGSTDSHVLYISGGFAIVHGHFVNVEDTSDTAIAIDLLEANQSSTSEVLSGKLCIGMRAVYSNNTISASMKPENSNNLYEGIQFVILPENQFKLPEGDGEHPVSESSVTAHLKLGTIIFNNNEISACTPNEHRHECLDGERISNIDKLLEATYVQKLRLDSASIYAMPGKDSDPQNNWQDITGSLVKWDNSLTSIESDAPIKPIWRKDNATNISGRENILDEAAVRYDDSDDKLKLVLPHVQPAGRDGTMYYAPNEVVIPSANRATGSGGVLDRSWVNFINGIDNKIASMYRMPGGKMRKFIDVLTDRSDLPKPPIAYYADKNRNEAYYDTRLQYSFNLLQTQVAQLNNMFLDFQSKLESEWVKAVEADIDTSDSSIQSSINSLRSSLANFQGDISSISAGIQNSSDALNAHLDSYNALANRVTTLENEWRSVSNTQSSDEEDSVITNIQTDIEKLQNDLNSLQVTTNNKIQNTLSQLNSLYESLYGANKDGSSGDVKDAATSIEQLRSQYDYLYDAIHDLYDGITSEVQRATASIQNNILTILRQELDAQFANLASEYNISAEWSPGDYVLVAQDQTLTTDESSLLTYPSTMYVVVPGMTPVDSKYVASYYDVVFTDLSTPINKVSSQIGSDVWNNALDTYSSAVDTLKRQVPTRFVYGYELGSNDVTELSSQDSLPDVYNSTVMIDELYSSNVLIEGVRGVPGKDYFVLRYRFPKSGNNTSGTTYVDEISGQSYAGIQYQIYTWVSVYFTLNLVNNDIELDVDNPVILSGGVPYAEESRVGGFLNVGSDVYGGGYIHRDESGHLRLNDFELLAAGVSAYQLGEDRTEGAGLDISELQSVFDQYINQRVAFPNTAQMYKVVKDNLRSDVITIELNIGSTAEGTLNIYDIDSRFNTAVHLKISGQSTENVVLNIRNCQRLRITLDATSNPTILVDNVCLYYDAEILDRISQIKGLSLWYMRYDSTDPDLQVNGMTVMNQNPLEAKGTYDFWKNTNGNNNTYAYDLRQITFADDGTIIGIGVAVTDNITANMMPQGTTISASSFVLPQSAGFVYPITRLTKRIKVTGDFVTAYKSNNTYLTKQTNFNLITQKYQRYGDVREQIDGVISFFTRSDIVSISDVDDDTLSGLTDEFAIDGWESGAYHIFYGGVIE